MSFLRQIVVKGDPFAILTLIFGIGLALSPPGTISGPIARALESARAQKAAQKAAQDAVRAAARRSSPQVKTAGGNPFVEVALLCSALVLVDQFAGWDILYRAFGVDILPKSPLEKRLREERCRWRRARPARVREAFFQLERERLDAVGVRYEEEPVGTPTLLGEDGTLPGAGLVDPADVRVFFVSGEEGDVVGKISVVFNVDSSEPGVLEMVDRTTRWILTEQAEWRLAGGKLDMPCKIERVFRDRSEDEYLLQQSQSEDDGSTLADAWDRREKAS